MGQAWPSAVPDSYKIVAQEFTVLDGTLSPLSLLEPRRDAIVSATSSDTLPLTQV